MDQLYRYPYGGMARLLSLLWEGMSKFSERRGFIASYHVCIMRRNLCLRGSHAPQEMTNPFVYESMVADIYNVNE